MPFDGILPSAGFMKIVNAIQSLKTYTNTHMHTQKGFIVSQERNRC